MCSATGRYSLHMCATRHGSVVAALLVQQCLMGWMHVMQAKRHVSWKYEPAGSPCPWVKMYTLFYKATSISARHSPSTQSPVSSSKNGQKLAGM